MSTRSATDGLDPAQREAVLCTEGPLLILAGAGSGKTRVICHRLAHLLQEGIPARAIFTVTFTNKAAGEMVRRVGELSSKTMPGMWVSTFHSAAARMLRRDFAAAGRSGDFTIYDQGDSVQLVKEVMRDLGIDPKLENPRRYVEAISRAKDEMLAPDAFLESTRLRRDHAEKVHAIYLEYQRRLARANALDFGDLLVEAVRLLERPEILERYQDQFRYFMVDEYQDTNHVQYRLVRLLSSATGNLCVVGDDDQSIYEWRGADRRNILSFTSDFPEARIVELYRNYRSTQPILDAASALIARNVRFREKRLFTDQTGGEAPRLWTAATEYDEVERVVAGIRRNCRSGARLSDHAVFYRVHAQSRVIEEQFSAAGMSYQILNGLSFYQRAEIKDVVAYLKLLANSRDDISLKRVINNPARGIGATTLARLDAISGDAGLFALISEGVELDGLRPATRKKIAEFVDLIRELGAAASDVGVAELLRRLLERTGYCLQYDGRDSDDMTRIENVGELVSAADEFQSSSLDPSLSAFLERISLATDVDTYDESADAVTLSTLHSAKGLEFRHVFVVGAEETLFPHVRVMNDDDSSGGLEEERRLAYVGFTRAKETLTLCHAEERRIYGRIVRNRPSRFLVESGIAPTSKSDFAVSDLIVTEWVSAPKAVKKSASEVQPAALGAFSEGDEVKHRKFGVGRILYVSEGGDENEVLQVRFRSGVKNLYAKYANLTKA